MATELASGMDILGGRVLESRLETRAKAAVRGQGSRVRTLSWVREVSRSGFGGRKRKREESEERKEERSTHLLRSHATNEANQKRSLSSK